MKSITIILINPNFYLQTMVTEEQRVYWNEGDGSYLSVKGQSRGARRVGGLIDDALNEPGLSYVKRYDLLAKASEIASCLPGVEETSNLKRLIEKTRTEVDKKFASQFTKPPRSSTNGQ